MATNKPETLVDVTDDVQSAVPDVQPSVHEDEPVGPDAEASIAELSRPEPLRARDGSPAAALWNLSSRVRHLNHGSYGAVPVFAQLRRMAYLQDAESAPQRWHTSVVARVAQARIELADFVGVDAERFGFVPNASAGMTASIRALGLSEGAELLVTDHTYGVVDFSARREARQRGATVRVVPLDIDATAEEVLDVLGAALATQPAGLVVDAVTSATAREFPVAALAELAHTHGVPLLVDAAQAPGVYDRAAAGVAASAWVGNLHKFACGFRGTAVLVAEEKFAENLYPLIDSWGMDDPFPGRFDNQGTLDYTPYLATVDAITGLEDRVGWDEIRAYIGTLLNYATEVVADSLDAASGGQSRVDVGMPTLGMRLLRLPGALAASKPESEALRKRIARELGFETQITSWRGAGYLRLAAHAYNTAEDYERFAEDAVPTIAQWGREG